MTPEQQASLVTAYGTLLSAVGAIGSAFVAGMAIRVARQANKHAEKTLELAREERLSAMTSSLFNARLALLQDFAPVFSEMNNSAEAFVEAVRKNEAVRQNPDSTTEGEKRSVNEAAGRLSKAIYAIADVYLHHNSVAPRAFMTAWANFYGSVRDLSGKVTLEDIAPIEERIKVARRALIHESRRMLGSDNLDPRIDSLLQDAWRSESETLAIQAAGLHPEEASNDRT